MSDAPQGTVTLLFTDIEGSTGLLQQVGERYADLLAEHSRKLRTAAQAHQGYEVDTQGDAFLFAFARAQDALLAAVDAQRGLASVLGPRSSVGIRVRMGLHTGEPQWTGDRYIGLDLHRGARIMAAGHGGQVLLSQTTCELVQGDLPPGVTLRDMGLHRLKDLRRPRQLYQAVIAGLPDEFPPLKTLDARPNNLPSALTPLIGREVAARQVAALLQRDGVRLVTLMGPGGVGKTRLSLQVAADLLDEFADGVYFVGLAAITDPTHVMGAVAQTLGVREQGGQSLLAALTDHLRDKRLLLVLDNFEQITAAAPQVAALFSQCPRLKALVTSRAALRIRGEHEFPVAPLPLPPKADRRPQTADGRDTEYGIASTEYASRITDYASRITQYASVELFVQRARAVKPDFQVTPANARAIADICYRLDGLPLAIELAAARIRLLPPQAILARLDHRLKLLTGGARDLPERHQTLRAAIEWSYDLLDPTRRTLFRRLAVFVGGGSLEAVEAVCGDDGRRTTDGGGQRVDDVLEGLEALINESLIIQRDQPDGAPRFHMLETIREFALEQLDADNETSILYDRQASYFLGLAETAAPKLIGPEQAEWLERLQREHNNLGAALDWLRQGDPERLDLGRRLAAALTNFWYLRGYFSEGRQWFQTLLDPDPASLPARLPDLAPEYAHRLVRVYNGAGVLAWAQADYGAARGYFEQVLVINQRLGNRRSEAAILNNLGLIALEEGDYPRAQDLYQRSLALSRVLDDRASVASTLNNLGLIARDQGDYAAARASFQESLAMWRQLGDQSQIALALNNLGEAAWLQGNLALAAQSYNQSLGLCRELEDRRGMSFTLLGLGRVALAQGDRRQAHALFHESMSIRQDLNDRRGLVECLEEIACSVGHASSNAEAVQLLSAVDAFRQALHISRPPVEQERYTAMLTAMRDHLGGPAFEAAYQAGQSLTLEKAVTLALSL
ncbi:MAG: tetratricopeptide repeat protein [Anaerolineae bacterium]|nr:tetratricopeptide repeat protein [Anaerolineae bacterium]